MKASGYIGVRVSPFVAQYLHAIRSRCLPPLHTGRADFPHPALPATLGTSLHNVPIDPVIQGVKPKLRFLLGFVMQFLSQKREFRRQRPRLRSGIQVQAVLPSLNIHMWLVGLLRSTGITRRHHYYEPRRLPHRAEPAVMPSRRPLGQVPTRTGLPGSWLICRRVPPPITPESPTAACAYCLTVDGRLRHLWQVGHSHKCNEAESGSQTLRLTTLRGAASPHRITPRDARVATRRTGNYHGKHFAAC